MYRAYVYKLKPSAEQSDLLKQCCGNARWMWNHLLDYSIKKYESQKKGVNRIELQKEAQRVKYKHDWLQISDAKSFEFVAANLVSAYSHFFRRMKAGEGAGHPRFKAKGCKESFAVAQMNVAVGCPTIQIWNDSEGQWVKLSKLGWFNLAYYRELPEDATIKRATIKLESNGNWYVSLLCQFEDVEVKPISIAKAKKAAVGIDLGLTHFATLCWGENEAESLKIDNPRYLQRSLKRLALLQRRLSRKAKGSANRNKAKQQVAKLHFRVKRQRRSFLEYWSRYIAERFHCVSMETLDIASMKQFGFGKSISDASWSIFTRLLGYKCSLRGKHFFRADQWFASSKLSYWTGERNESLTLNDRFWTDSSGNLLDRDLNAAMNLRYAGLHAMTTGEILSTQGFQELYG